MKTLFIEGCVPKHLCDGGGGAEREGTANLIFISFLLARAVHLFFKDHLNCVTLSDITFKAYTQKHIITPQKRHLIPSLIISPKKNDEPLIASRQSWILFHSF